MLVACVLACLRACGSRWVGIRLHCGSSCTYVCTHESKIDKHERYPPGPPSARSLSNIVRYNSTGPGANPSARWKGSLQLTAKQADELWTPAVVLQGWVPPSEPPTPTVQTTAPAAPALVAPSGASAGKDGVCDIYRQGGVPCVAAHSITRALFSSYSGPLYTVSKDVQGGDVGATATKDIYVMSAGGVADAKAQEDFCGSSSCIVRLKSILQSLQSYFSPVCTVFVGHSSAFAVLFRNVC